MALIAFAFLGDKVPFIRQEEGRVSERQFAFREKRSIQNGPNEEQVREAIFASIDPGRIASTLRLVTKKPHVAGTAANRRVAQNIAQIWRANGIERWFMGKSMDFADNLTLKRYSSWNTMCSFPTQNGIRPIMLICLLMMAKCCSNPRD